nr:uncharacterized protein CFP56_69675 [Quercus suber]
MHRHLSAEWRFYHAFFRWSTLHETHMYNGACGNQARSYRSQSRRAGPRMVTLPAQHCLERRLFGTQTQKDELPPITPNPAVMSDEDLPFASLKPYQYVVRFRTKAYLVVEMSIPVTRVVKFQEIFGHDLDQLLNGFSDTKIDLGQTLGPRNGSGALRSVLISGPIRHASWFQTVLRRPAEEESTRRSRLPELQSPPPLATEKDLDIKVNTFTRVSAPHKLHEGQYRMLISDIVWMAASVKAIMLCNAFRDSLGGVASVRSVAPFDCRMENGQMCRLRTLIIRGHDSLPFLLQELFLAHDLDTLRTGPSTGDTMWLSRTKAQVGTPSEPLSSDAEDDKSSSMASAQHVSNDADQESQTHQSFPASSAETTNSVSTASLADQLRAAVRPLTYPLVVITANNAPEIDDKYPRGVAASSFSTISLSPPTISFNLKLPSRSWNAMKATKEIIIHILAGTPAGAAVAAAFTKPYDAPAEPFRALEKQSLVRLNTSESDRKTFHLQSVLRDTESVVVALVRANVVVEQSIKVADHVVVVAEVHAVEFPGTDPDQSLSQVTQHMTDTDVLGYGDRNFRRTGEDIRKLDITVPAPALGDNDRIMSGKLRGSRQAMLAAQQRDLEEEFESNVATLDQERRTDAVDASEMQENDFFRLAAEISETYNADVEEKPAVVPETQVSDPYVQPLETQAVDTSTAAQVQHQQSPPPPPPHQVEQNQDQQLEAQTPSSSSSSPPPPLRRYRPSPMPTAGNADGQEAAWGMGHGVLKKRIG